MPNAVGTADRQSRMECEDLYRHNGVVLQFLTLSMEDGVNHDYGLEMFLVRVVW